MERVKAIAYAPGQGYRPALESDEGEIIIISERYYRTESLAIGVAKEYLSSRINYIDIAISLLCTAFLVLAVWADNALYFLTFSIFLGIGMFGRSSLMRLCKNIGQLSQSNDG